jgi:hypothetical protein
LPLPSAAKAKGGAGGSGGGKGGGGGGSGGKALSSTSELKGSFVVPVPQVTLGSVALGAAGAGAQQSQPPPPAADEQTCQFCGRHDPSFDDATLDLHFWRDCPMLMTCAECEQVVEISYLREHLLTECERSAAPARGEQLAEGCCPLCANVVPADDDGWTNHLLVATCRRNPRRVQAR